jgi:hypothetical protein
MSAWKRYFASKVSGLIDLLFGGLQMFEVCTPPWRLVYGPFPFPGADHMYYLGSQGGGNTCGSISTGVATYSKCAEDKCMEEDVLRSGVVVVVEREELITVRYLSTGCCGNSLFHRCCLWCCWAQDSGHNAPSLMRMCCFSFSASFRGF